MPKPRIGIVGFGYIGSYVYQQLTARPELGLDIAFVYNRTPGKLAELPGNLVLEDLASFAARCPDLVVELAHPLVTQQYGRAFLERADYLPLSLTALADPDLERELVATAQGSGTRLCVPHGAIVGLESLEEGRQIWEDVSITMRKPPRTLDFSSASHLEQDPFASATVLYDGPTRGICPLFPRNVNSHAAVALGGIGFDRTHSVLVADPGLEVSVIEVVARGQGVEVQTRRANPMKGVSGVFTLISALASVCRATVKEPGLWLC